VGDAEADLPSRCLWGTMSLRERLLWALLTLTSAAWLALMLWQPPHLRDLLLLIFAATVTGGAAVTWHYRARMTPRLLTANLVLGSIVHLAVAAAVTGGARLVSAGLIPGIARDWQVFLAAIVGIGAAYFTWTRARARPTPEAAVADRARDIEPPPPADTPTLQAPPDWEDLAFMLQINGDAPRIRQLGVLRRVYAATQGPGRDHTRLADVRRILHQEALRIEAESAAQVREADEEDVLTQAAALLEWGVQKLPELGELDLSDLLMAKTIADIRTLHSHVERRFVDHRQLRAIHPIDRDTANEKCDARAAAARDALPVLQANSMRLSEALIASDEALRPFASVTGFQVVDLGEGEGYVTFEGNGRREALSRAFGEDFGVEVEVRLFHFPDEATAATIRRRVRRVQRWKLVTTD
jgi:hypothetical protein